MIRATEYFARLEKLDKVCVIRGDTPHVHVHPCYTSCTPLLHKVCQIAKSKVQPDPMFGNRNKVGYGLITTRKIHFGEKFYTVWETGVDVQIVPKRKGHDFQVFSYGHDTKQVICPLVVDDETFETLVLDQPENKPLLFFLQHDSVGNCKVRIVTPHCTPCTP